MKKLVLSLMLVAVGLTLVACKKEKSTSDLDDIRDHLERTEVVNGKSESYNKANTYYSTTSNVTTMNHYSTSGANESALYELIVGTLYQGDFDWSKALEDDLIEESQIGDPSGISEEDLMKMTYKRYPSLAKSTPYAVNEQATETETAAAKLLLDNVWDIELRDDIVFEDGLKINAHVFAYSWKQLLSPLQNNVRVTYLTDAKNLSIVNGKSYYMQGKTNEDTGNVYPAVKWSDVGFEVLSDTKFRITLTDAVTQYDLMSKLSSGIYSAVHPEVYEASKDVTGVKASYGSIDFPIPSSGPYLIKNWQDGTSYTFNVNKSYKGYDAEGYDIKALNFRVNSNETSILDEFKSGNLDVAGVGSATAYPDYKDNEFMKETPSTSTFRLALGGGTRPEGSKWEHSSVSNAAMAKKEFRQAMYFALDRENYVANVRPNARPSGTLLTSLYQVTEEAGESYRSTQQAMDALKNAGMTDEAVDNYGFDLNEARRLFDKVYEELRVENKLKGGKIYVQVVLFDAESNRKVGGWVKTQLESAFGTERIGVIENYTTEDGIYEAWDTRDYDLTFSAWQGMQFDPAGLLTIVYSSLNAPDTMLEGVKTDDLPVTVNMNNFKLFVEGLGANATAEQKAIVAKLDANGQWNGILDIADDIANYDTLKYTAIADLIGLASLKPEYPGKFEDFASITAGIEAAVLGEYIAIPIMEQIGASVYAERVIFDLAAYHTYLGWGGYRYMSLSTAN